MPDLRDPLRGPSPRVRGSRHPVAAVRGGVGVHPRVCGEASAKLSISDDWTGPSPRVRGSRSNSLLMAHGRGSIPACAGKPGRGSSPCAPARVHPRVCGEAARALVAGLSRTGPSPRVRGSPVDAQGADRADGSIPACAGKPASAAPPTSPPAVHPRVCGEAPAVVADVVISTGPSPRVRGSPRPASEAADRHGSIPACAGKPSPGGCCPRRCRVHPRVCGEAMSCAKPTRSATGPSPRVRGSQLRPAGGDVRQGSIPACAGKPCRRPPR